MKRKKVIFGLLCIVLLAGCASLRGPGATVEGRVISNPSLGFFGFSFEIPQGFELYNPAVEAPEPLGKLQQLAARIYDLNQNYHPRGNEMSYDGFLMLSEKTAVLLMMLTVDTGPQLNTTFFEEDPLPQADAIPLYNITAKEPMGLSHNQSDALCSSGHAFEQKGWYYAKDGRKRTRFQYEACEVSGSKRDRYVLMGFCLPGDEEVLRLQVRTMAQNLRF